MHGVLTDGSLQSFVATIITDGRVLVMHPSDIVN